MENILWPCFGFYTGLTIHLCSGHPIDSHSIAENTPWMSVTGLVSASLLLTSVLLVAVCVCCRRTKGFQEFSDTASSHSLSAAPGPPPTTSSEFTIFPPLPPGDRSSVVRFEPLPDLRPAPPPPTHSRRPAAFSAALSHGLSAHDWFHDPHANFPRHQMKYLRELGRGWFGRVVEGEAQGLVPGEQTSKVIVKILHEDATPTDQMYFLHEMKPYRDLQHPNLLRLLGHCLETDPFLVLLESCPGGDLKSFLSTNAATSDALNQQGVTLQMACNISAGLQHMLDGGFVHTDLATRNCMVTPDLTVKIGDYGNGIETYKDEYYCAGDVALPIRWCAPETLHCTDTTIETKEVTPCANVWTLGVVLWELCEFGKLPYAELTDDEVIVRVLGSGTYRLGLPTLPSPHRHNLYLVMKQCWSPSLQRPALSQVHRMLHHMYSSRERHMKEGDTCSLNSDEDFERRWEAFKPNTITKTDHMVAVEEISLPPPRHVEEQQQSDLFSDRTSVDSGILSRERGNADAYSSTSPQPSLSSSTGGEFFTPTIRHHHKSPSLQNLRGSIDDLSESTTDSRTLVSHYRTPDGSLREEVADLNLFKMDNTDLKEETKVNETQEFDSWLQGVETTNDEDAKFVQKISEAIRDLDDALALEKTSSSSESSSNSASHHDSPAKDVTSADQNVVLDFRLGRLYSDATEKFIEETFPPDSYQDDSFLELNRQSGKARRENRGTDSGTDTEDETWQIRIEQGEFTEKVKQKSKSVADLMILTHIDSSEGSDSDTPSLTWSFERGSNNRGSLTKQRAVLSNKVSLNVAAGLLFGSESNIHGAVLGQEFKDTLEKLHAAQKDSSGMRGPFLDQRTSLSEEDTLSSPIASSVVPIRGNSQINGSIVSSNHNGKENFLSNDASEKEHREEEGEASASIVCESHKESVSDNASILASGSLKESASDSALFTEPAAKQSDNLISVQKCSEVPHIGDLSSDVNIPSNNLDKFSSSVIPLSNNINCCHLDLNKLSVSMPTNLSSDVQKKLEENEIKLILPETSLEHMIPKSVASTIETIEHLRQETVEPEEISLTNEEQSWDKEPENTFPVGYILETKPLVGSSADKFDASTLHPSRTKRCVENERLESSSISEPMRVSLEGDFNKITLSCMESSPSAPLSQELHLDSLETDSVNKQGSISNADKTKLDKSIVQSNVFAVSDVKLTDNLMKAGVQDDSSDGQTEERASVILGPCEDYTLDYFKGLKTTFIEGEKTREHCEDSYSGEYFVSGNASEDKDNCLDTRDKYLSDARQDVSSDTSFSLEQENSTTSDHFSENKSQGLPNILRRRINTGPTVAKGRNIDWDGRIEDFIKIVPESNVPKSLLNEADNITVEDINEVEDCCEPSSSKDSVCFIHEVESNMKESPLKEIQCLVYTKEPKTYLEQSPLNENRCSIYSKESKTELEQSPLNENLCSIDTKESKTDLEQSPLNENLCSVDIKESKTVLEQSPLNENLCSIDTKESKTDLEQSPLNENLCSVDIKESKTDLEQSPLNENLCSVDIKESKPDLEQSPLNENLCFIDFKKSKTDLEQSPLNENLCSVDIKKSKTDLEQSPLNENLCSVDIKESKTDLEQSPLNENLCSVDIKESKTDLEQSPLNENLCSIDFKESKTDLEQSPLNENRCSIDIKESKTDLEQSPLNENLCSVDIKESKTDLEQSPLNENLCSIDFKESKTDLEQSPLNENRCSIDIKESKTDLEQSPLNENLCSVDIKESKTDLEQSPLNENLCFIDFKESKTDLEQSPLNENLCSVDIKESKTGLEESSLNKKLIKESKSELEQSPLNENLCSIDIKESKTDLEQSPLNENLCYIYYKESKTELEQSPLNENRCCVDTKESKTDLEQSPLNENLCSVDSKESKAELKESSLNENVCSVDIKEFKKELEPSLLNENLCFIDIKESKTDLEQSPLNENLCYIDSKESNTEFEQSPLNENRCCVDTKESKTDLEQSPLNENLCSVDSKESKTELEESSLNENLCSVDIKESKSELEQSLLNESLCSIDIKESKIDLEQSLLNENLCSIDNKESKTELEKFPLNENWCSIDNKESKTDLEQSLLNENPCSIDIKESKTDLEQSPLNENWCSINIKESKANLEPFSSDKTIPSEISVERSDNVSHNSPNKADITSIIVCSALDSESGQSLTRMDDSTDNLLTPDSLQTVRFKLANLSGSLGVPSLNFIAATPVQSGRNSPEILGSRLENNNKTIVDINDEPNEVLNINIDNKNLEDTSYYILEELDSNNMSLESIKNSNSNDHFSLSDNPDTHKFQMGNGSFISPSNLSTKENIDLDQTLDSLLPNILSSSLINGDEYDKDSSEIHDLKPTFTNELSANVSSEMYTGLSESIKKPLEVDTNDTLKATNGGLSFSESQLSPQLKECSSSSLSLTASEKGKLETCDSSGTEDSAFDFPRSEEMSITLSHSKDAPSRESPHLNLLDGVDDKSGTWQGEPIRGDPSFPIKDFASVTDAEEGVIAPEMKIIVVEDFDMNRSELEVGEDFGLDVVKHSTPDDERSSDSGFRDKGSLSESCEDACDEKYHLEDIEAELEETFNRGGFAYVTKGIEPEDEDVTESEPGGKEPTPLPVDANCLLGMTDRVPNFDDTLKLLPSSSNEFHIVSLEIDKEHHEVCESNEDSLENMAVVPPEAAFVDTDQTFVKSPSKLQGHSASDHSSWKEENPNEKLFQNHNSEFLRPVLSQYTEPLVDDTVIPSDVNPHLPLTGSGWFLHPPIFREDTSEIEMYQCPKDGTSSPCSTSSKDSKCDDSNNSENSYVSFTLDEEFVTAIRNELREKLPLAQQHSEDEEDDSCDELATDTDEDRADVTIHYNAYPPPLSPILEEGESSINTTLSDQYSPFLIANFKESDSRSASPLFSLDFNEQAEKNVVAMNTKKFEEEIREALANCSLSSDETESSATKDVKNASVLVEDLDPQSTCINVNGTAIVVVQGTPKPVAEDDVLMVDMETNEATLVESLTPKSHLAFVRNKKSSEDCRDVSPSTESSNDSAGLSTSGDFDTFVIKKGRFDDSNFISSKNIKDITEIDENFTPDSISPDWGKETSVSRNVSPGRVDATLEPEVSHHKPHGNGEREFESPRSLTETPASRASARTSDSDTISEFFLTPSEKSPEFSSHFNTPFLSDTTDPKLHRRIYSSNRRVTTNPMFDDVEEIASRQPNNEAAEIMSALENRVLVNYQEKTSKQLPENINMFANDLCSSSESDHAEMLSLEGSSESSPVTKKGDMPSPALGPLLSMWPTNEDSYTDSSQYSGESSNEASPQNHMGVFLSGKKHDLKKGMNIVITDSEGEVEKLSPSSVRSEELDIASSGRSTEAFLREERDWSLSNQETSTKAPMPSPEEESWKKIPSMLAFSDMNDMMGRCENEEGQTTGRFSEISFMGPKDRREDNADMMSTSFSNKDEGGESYTPDWESESESTNEEDNSSSSGEFIWKEGEKEEQLSGPKVSGSPPATKAYEGLSDFPMEVIAEEDEDDDEEDDDEDDDGSISSGSGAEFVPSAWNSAATPNRSSLRSPDKKSEQKKNVSFKKQKYHCVYEYPREVSDSEGESQHEIVNRHQWDSYQPPQVDYASYADWELLDEQVPDLVSSQDTDNDQDLADTPAPQHFDFYKLSNVDYDFGGEEGLLSDDGEFFISSSARPFKFSSMGGDTTGTGNQFYPGQADVDDVKLDFAKESHLALLGVSVDSCDDEVNTSLLTFTPESADRPAVVLGHDNLFCIKETHSDHTIWSPSGESLPSLDGKRPVTELSPAGVLKKSLITGGPQNSIGDISNAGGNFKNPDSICNSETSVPMSPTGLGELRHTRDRLKLDLVGSNGGFLLDPPGGSKRRAGVRGEASLLDSGDDTEDSGIESSNGATSTRTLVMAITGEKHVTSAT